ncbi:MAG: methyl-accepting chemotaxis protein [Thermodesulfobacteriota bacterium]
MREMKLGTKIMAGFIAVSVITLILGIIGYYGAVQSEGSMDEIGAVRLPSVDSLLVIKEKAENIRGTMRTLGIAGLPTEMRQRQYDNLAAAREAYEAAWKIYEPLPQTPEEAKLWKEFVPAWEAWRAESNKLVEMARQFDLNGIPNPTELSRQIERFTKDHYALVQKVLHLLYMTDAAFEGGDDHTACNAGKWLPTFKTDNQELSAVLREFADHHKRFHEAVGRIKRLVAEGNTPEAQAVYQKEMLSEMKEVFGTFEHMLAVANKSAELMATAEQQMLGPVTQKQREAIALLDQIVRINREVAEAESKSAHAQSAFLKVFNLVAMIVGVVLALVLGILITRGITRPLNRAIEGLSEGSDQVSSAADQVSSASQELAEGSSEQAAAVEETSSSLEEMSSMTRQNADNASQANALMEEAKNTVTKAGASMKDMTKAMGEISNSGQEISKIIKTIDEIAFQTNLLALNAAVEAARAGEAGAGFAVVADEVRNLAMRAAEAAKNTASLIEGTIVQINRGAELVRSTDEAFSEVTRNSAKVAELVGEIAAASQEQAQGIQQVNQAMSQMDTVTQKNAANAEETASASEELNAQAASMLEIVNSLATMVGGTGMLKTMARKPAAKVQAKRLPPAKAPAKAPAKPAATPPAKVRPAGAKVAKADEVIPMDEDFGDF